MIEIVVVSRSVSGSHQAVTQRRCIACKRSTEGAAIVDIAAAAMGHFERPSAGVVQRREIAVMRIWIAYRARSGRREIAVLNVYHARRRSTEGNTAGSIATDVIAHVQGRSVGVVGWVEVAVSVTCWEDVVPILGILVANEARSGRRKRAPPGSSFACRRSTVVGTIGGRTVVTMRHPKGRCVRVVWRVEIAVNVAIRVATILILRKKSSIALLIKNTDRSTDIAESVTNVAAVDVFAIIWTTGTEVEAAVGI